MTLELTRPGKVIDIKSFVEGSSSTAVPVGQYQIGDSEIEIFRAKGFDSTKFAHPWLEEQVRRARGSYKIYGEVPLIDGFDQVAAVYLARNRFPVGTGPVPLFVEAFYSLRFVPMNGNPLGNEDLQFYVYQDQKGNKHNIWDLIRNLPEVTNLADSEITHQVVAQSRFSVSRSFVHKDIKNSGFLLNSLINERKKAGQFFQPGLSFALMNDQLFKDYPSVELMTGQLHHDLSDKVLAYPSVDGKKTLMPFTPAYSVLGVNPEQISIDRDREGVYALDVPGYFLDLPDFSSTLRCLLEERRLSGSSLDRYLQIGTSLSQVLEKPNLDNMRDFGKLLRINGPIEGSNITGEELRAVVNQEVADGPVLRLMRAKTWNAGVGSYLKTIESDWAKRAEQTS